VTTEDDFQRAIDADPRDWQTRLVFADWLDERGDPRADGYRALGGRRMLPDHGRNTDHGSELWWWTSIENQIGTVPSDWFALIEGLEPADQNFKPRATGNNTNTRREAEDAAALAFSKLPAQRQTELAAQAPLDTGRNRKRARGGRK
jgi:uncharacterized protein (TIGR02996 family)